MTLQERKRHGNAYTLLNRKLEAKWFPKVKKALNSKVSSLILKVKQDGIDAGVRYLSIDLANYELSQVVSDMYSSVGVIHARRADNQLRLEIGKGNNFASEQKRIGFAQIWIDFIQNYLKLFLISKITFAVNETTRDALLKVLNDAIANGWGINETVKRLEDLPFLPYQAARIVRTEINRASNVGVLAQGENFEYELQKIWIAVKDSRTRGNPVTGESDHADHFHMDGQTVDFEGDFIDSRSGVHMAHPGDPNAEAGDTVNCRCNFATKAKRGEDGRLIPRLGKAVEMQFDTKMDKEMMEKVSSMERIMAEMKTQQEIMAAANSRPINIVLESIQIPRVDMGPVEAKIDGISEAVTNVGDRLSRVESKVEGVTDDVSDNKSQYMMTVKILKDKIESLVKENSVSRKEDKEEFISIIKGIDFNPEITVEYKNTDMIAELRNLIVELSLSTGMSLSAILEEVRKKHKWKLELTRDADKLLTGATAIQI